MVPVGQPFPAMRYDLLARPIRPGLITFQGDYWDWTAATLRGRAATAILVS